MEFLILDTRFILEQEGTKRQAPILVITSQNEMFTIPHGFCQFDNICHVVLKKNPFLSGVRKVFIYVSSNFTLDSGITEYWQCHIGLQFQTCFIIFDLLKFREN